MTTMPPNERCARLLEAAAQLPSPSPVLARLVGLAGRRDVSLDELESLFEQDPALCTRLLRTINSAAYRRRSDVESVAHAVRLLGVERLVRMATEQVTRTLARGELKPYATDGDDLWRHAQVMAAAGRSLAEATGRADVAGRVYICALLADLGVVALAHAVPEAEPPSADDLDDYATYLALERAVYGAAHPEVGAALARHWRLPDWLRAAIEYHHDPMACPAPWTELAALVHAADAIAASIGGGLGAVGQRIPVEQTLDSLGIDAPVILEVMLSLTGHVRATSEAEATAEAQQ